MLFSKNYDIVIIVFREVYQLHLGRSYEENVG